MPFTAEQRAVSASIWAQVHAERAAHRAANEHRLRQREPGFIGPVDRLEMFRRASKRTRLQLAPAAQAHIDAGGCSGDFCPNCNGKGWMYETYDHGKVTECACYHCHGKGMGK